MNTEMSLAGQAALVTGASSGIGSEIAKAMAQAGARVCVNYAHNATAAAEVVREITKSGGDSFAHRADVSKEDEVKTMFETLAANFGTIDILINNAGIQQDSSFADMTLEQWRMVLDINLTGGFLCAREAVREFLRRGKVPEQSTASGKIIFISSVHEMIPWAGHANYASSKGGVMMLMKTIAQELAPQKIRVNSIAPGAIKTPINRKAWEKPEAADSLRQLIPYGRIGDTRDIASIAVWLASDAADYITGTTIFADGGMMLYPGFRTGG
jgi:glucose 1-dehydrogenase